MKNKLYLLTLLFLPLLGLSQTDTAKTGTTVIFYSSSSTHSAPVEYNGNALKLGVLDIFSGLYGLHYERELSSVFAIQGGLGLTGRNFAAGILAEEGVEEYFVRPMYSNPDNDIFDNYYDFNTRKAKMGFFVSLHPKFYYTEDGFDGGYIGLILSHRKYNFEANDVTGVSSEYSSSEAFFNPSKTIEEFENNLILALSWGMQSIGDKVALDYNIALGMKKITGERRDVGEVRVSDFPFTEYQQVAKLNEISKTAFYFEMSLKLGINWSKSSTGKI